MADRLHLKIPIEIKQDRQHLRRPCKKCDKIFEPTGKYNLICNECNDFSNSNKNIVFWIRRGNDLLELKKHLFKDKRFTEIKQELIKLNKLISESLK